MEWRAGKTDRLTKELIWMAKNTAKDATHFLMDPHTMECGKTIRSVVKEHTSGQMGECTRATGWTTVCTGMVHTPGRTEGDMRAITCMTKSTEKVSMFGLMERSTMGCGKMGNSTGMATFTIRA